MNRFFFVAWMVPLVLLMSCASAQPEKPGRVVVGAGTSDDRSVIGSSNQQIFDAEHALSPDAPVARSNPAPASSPAPAPSSKAASATATASPAPALSSTPPASATPSPNASTSSTSTANP